MVTAALDVAEKELGGSVNVVVNCAGIATATRVLGKKGPHSLDSFLKVRLATGGPCGSLLGCIDQV